MMSWEVIIYTFIVACSIIVMAGLVVYAWRHRDAPGAKAFMGMMLLAIEWAFVVVMHFFSPTHAIYAFWHNAEYIGLAGIPVAWFILVLEYTGRSRWLALPRIMLFLTIPITTQVIVWSIGFYGHEFHPSKAGSWFWVHTMYSYFLLVLGIILLIMRAIHSSPLYRRQVIFLIGGLCFPLAINMAYTFYLIPPSDFDLAPVSLVLTGLMFAYSLFQYRLFDIIPVARATLIDNMKDGTLVLDIQGRIVDLNPSAKRILNLSSHQVIGQRIETIFPEQREWDRYTEANPEWQTEVRLDHEGIHSDYEMRVSQLQERRGRGIGWLLVFHDITDRKQVETTLMQTNAQLQQTLQELQRTQAELIQSEKMAMLGRLVASIAHEVNTPLGTIQAAAENTIDALRKTLQYLPTLLHHLSPIHHNQFFALVKRALSGKKLLPSRDHRRVKQALRRELTAQNVQHAWDIADTLVNMGIYDEIETFLPLLHTEHARRLVRIAHDLSLQQHNSGIILQAVNQMSKIVFALKNYVRYGESKKMIEAQITEGIDLVLMLYQNQFKHDIEVVKHYDNVPAIWCYPEELNQVWTNLIYNAIWAMNSNGRLEITVGRICAPAEEPIPILSHNAGDLGEKSSPPLVGGGTEQSDLSGHFETISPPPKLPHQGGGTLKATALAPGTRHPAPSTQHPAPNIQHPAPSTQYIVVQITDSGGGIPEEIKDRIFEPFFTTKVRGEGSGLGLDICKRIVAKHGGRIEFESKPGHTAFRVLLPFTANNNTGQTRQYLEEFNEESHDSLY